MLSEMDIPALSAGIRAILFAVCRYLDRPEATELHEDAQMTRLLTQTIWRLPASSLPGHRGLHCEHHHRGAVTENRGRHDPCTSRPGSRPRLRHWPPSGIGHEPKTRSMPRVPRGLSLGPHIRA